MAYEIMTRYMGQGEDVVGHTFDTKKEAQMFLKRHGWKPDPYNKGSYRKEGPTRMCGMFPVSVMHYVFIACVEAV